MDEESLPFPVILDNGRAIAVAYGMSKPGDERYLANPSDGRRPAVIVDGEGLVLKWLPDLATVEEQVEILFKAFNQEEFSHEGKFYTLPSRVPYRGYDLETLTLVPRPLNLPVECWQPVVSATDRGLDFMMKHGIKGIIGGGSALMAESSVNAYQAAHKRAGRNTELGEDLCFGISYHLAPTREQAIAEARPYYEEHAKMFAPLGFLGKLEADQVDALARRFDVAGWVRNCSDGTVECVIEGTRAEVQALHDAICRERDGFIKDAKMTESTPVGEITGFEIRS